VLIFASSDESENLLSSGLVTRESRAKPVDSRRKIHEKTAGSLGETHVPLAASVTSSWFP
jgi:hypothetical protein